MWNIQVIKRHRAKLLKDEWEVYDSISKNHNWKIRKFCSCMIYDATIVLRQKVDWYGLTVHTSQSETVQCPNRPKKEISKSFVKTSALSPAVNFLFILLQAKRRRPFKKKYNTVFKIHFTCRIQFLSSSFDDDGFSGLVASSFREKRRSLHKKV